MQTKEAVSAARAAVENGEVGRIDAKSQEVRDALDKVVASRIKEAENAEATEKKFAVLLERYEESVIKVCAACCVRYFLRRRCTAAHVRNSYRCATWLID